MNKSRKNKKIKGSGNFLSTTRVQPETAEVEEIMYFTIKWKNNNGYRIYTQYDPNNSYLTLNIGTSTDWIEFRNGSRVFDDVISIPTNNMIQLINLEIRDLDNELEQAILRRIRLRLNTTATDEITLKRQKYKYMAIKHYVTGMLDAEVSHIEPVSLQVGRRINNNTVVPEPTAELIPLSVAENPNTLYWGGKKSRKRKIKKTKRSKKSKTKKNKL
jgi:hypothetical protein